MVLRRPVVASADAGALGMGAAPGRGEPALRSPAADLMQGLLI